MCCSWRKWGFILGSHPDKKRKQPDEECFDDDDDFASLVQSVDFNEEIKGAAQVLSCLYPIFICKIVILVLPSPVKKSKTDTSLSQKLTKLKQDSSLKPDKKRRSDEENFLQNNDEAKPKKEKNMFKEKVVVEEEKKEIRRDKEAKFVPPIQSAKSSKETPKPVVQSPKGKFKDVSINLLDINLSI